MFFVLHAISLSKRLIEDYIYSLLVFLFVLQGPIDPVGVESLLLDGLLTCLIPLIALTNELEPFTEFPDRKTICDALTNLTFIAPF